MYSKNILQKIRKNGFAYLFIFPNLLLLIVFLVVPIFWIILISFQRGGLIGGMEFVGLRNYSGVFSDSFFVKAVLNNLKYTAIMVPVAQVLTLSVALLLNSISQKKWVNLFRSLLYLPMLGSTVGASIAAILLIYPEIGPIWKLFDFLGIPNPKWFADPRLVLVSIGVVEFWKGNAFYIITYYAALSNVPAELIEAAHLDGAKYLQRLFSVILPMIKPIISFGVIMACIWSLQLFDSVYVLTRGGPQDASSTMVWYIYKNIFHFNRAGVGGTMVVFLLVLTGVITLLNLRILGFGREESR